jgi:hypothetical protein
MMVKQIFAVTIGVLLICMCHSAQAGKLGDFERDSTEKRSNSRNDDHYRGHNHGYGYGYGYSGSRGRRRGSGSGDSSGSVLTSVIGTGLVNSMDLARRERLEMNPSLALRELGEPIIPYFRLDAAQQDVDSNIEAKDFYGQVGYGALGADLRYTRFTEEQPRDTLDVMWIHLLSRFSYYKHVEFDIGAGMVQMKGNERHEGFSFTMAALVYQVEWLGVEVRPTFAEINRNRLTDTDVSLHLRYSVGAVKFGYRWLKSENLELKGPYAGVVVRF